ncbi:MAG: type VII toxin-antitoxin system MntA family adenylyltransferase antitoxin [Candidatus Hodarchaeales archaeon]|jgi:predicted nucleotidyltransferase
MKINIPENIITKYKISFIILFGSVIRKEDSQLSDIDFAIFFNPETTPKHRFKVRNILIEEFSHLILQEKNVQIISLNDAPLSLSFRVLDEGELIYCKNMLSFMNYREQIWKFYFDFQYIEKIYVKDNLGLK